MIISWIISLAAGYLLNEEISLQRIRKNLSCSHEGWLLMKNPQALWAMGGGIILAFIKGYGWGYILHSCLGKQWYIAGGIFILSNVLAASQSKGLFYSPWLAMLGMSLAVNPAVFQWSLTAGAAVMLFTRRADISMQIWRFSLWLALLIITGLPECIFWTAIIWAAWFISGRLTPFPPGLIK